MFQAAVIILSAFALFVAGTRFGIWISENDNGEREAENRNSLPQNVKMLPVESRRIGAVMKHAHRRAMRKFR